jgi:hypothetical protein
MSFDLSSYANIVTVAQSDLSSVNSLRQQMAELNAQSKDEKLASALGIKTSLGEGLGELSTEALTGGIIKLVNTYGGSVAKSLLQSAGVDEGTANSLLSGDVAGAGKSFAKTLVDRVTGTDTEIPTTADELTGAVQQQFSGLVNGAGSQPSNILSRVVNSSNRQTAVEDPEGIEMQVFPPAPSQDDVIAAARATTRPVITNDLLPEGAGSIIESGQATQATIETIDNPVSALADTAGQVATAVAGGATDALTTAGGALAGTVANVGGVVANAGGAVAGAVANAGGAVAGATNAVANAGGALSGAVSDAVDAGVAVASEAVGAGLDATGILAPVGILVGLFGGLFGGISQAEEARKHANDVANAMASATLNQSQVLNPSMQFL